MTNQRFVNFDSPCGVAALLPCAQNLATVAQDLMKKESSEAWHRKLDGMLVSGVGVKGKADRVPQEPVAARSADAAVSAPAEDEKFKSQPRSSANRETKQAQLGRNLYQQAL
jgi:hypothetical protein